MNLSILKELFAGFVRTRCIGRHFRRLALLDSFAGTGVSREVPPTVSRTLVAAAQRIHRILAGYMVLTQCMKRYDTRRFGWQ
jgi:hypothetical protein